MYKISKDSIKMCGYVMSYTIFLENIQKPFTSRYNKPFIRTAVHSKHHFL